MWLEAIVTREDFVQMLGEILPVKIHLSDDGEAERWLLLHRANEVRLVPDEGLHVAFNAELQWSFAGLSPSVKIDNLNLMLRPAVGAQRGGQVLELHIEIEEADIRGLPAIIDSTIVKAVNSALSAKKVAWNFTETLTRSVSLGLTCEPITALNIGVAWGKRRISEEAMVLVVSFTLNFVRDAKQQENMMGQINSAETLAPAIEKLQSFCRGEMSAVETYNQAMQATQDPRILMQLRGNLASHEARVRILCQRIADLGGSPPEGSGAWGVFAKAVEGTASALGEKSALSVLEEGEDHGLADYRSDLSHLDLDSRRLVSEQILPQQAKTHRALADIKRSLS